MTVLIFVLLAVFVLLPSASLWSFVGTFVLSVIARPQGSDNF